VPQLDLLGWNASVIPWIRLTWWLPASWHTLVVSDRSECCNVLTLDSENLFLWSLTSQAALRVVLRVACSVLWLWSARRAVSEPRCHGLMTL
jgi:hypothetical protein